MNRSLEEQAAEMKARRLAQHAERRAARSPAQAFRKPSLHDRLIESILIDYPNAKISGFRKSLIKFWKSQPYENKKWIIDVVVAQTGCNRVLKSSFIPDAYCWMAEPEIHEDVCIVLHIFEAVVSHDINEDKVYYYEVLNEAGFCTRPKVQLWIHRIDRFNIETIWDPRCFGFRPHTVRRCNNVIGDVL